MATLLELTKERLRYVTEKFGADGPMAKQFQMQLMIMEKGGIVDPANHARADNNNKTP